MSVRHSAWNNSAHWTDFDEIWYLRFFRKPVQKIKVSLNCDENNGYFTWRLFTFITISRWILPRRRSFLDKSCRENQNPHFMSNNVFGKSCRLGDNVEKCGGARGATNDVTVWRMRVACWISKATRTHAHARPGLRSTIHTMHARSNTDKRVIFLVFHGNNGFANAP
jgi:hypothetical protein